MIIIEVVLLGQEEIAGFGIYVMLGGLGAKGGLLLVVVVVG